MSAKRIISMLLTASVAFASVVFAACTEKPAETDAAVTSEAAVTAEGETTELRYVELVPAADFGGYSFNFANDSLSSEYYSAIDIEELTGEALDDAIYERNRRVESRYNVVIKAVNTGAPDLIRASVTAGTGDFAVGYALQASVMSLITGGYLRTINSLPTIDMSKPYWDQGAQETLMVDGNMFHGYLDISFDHYESMATVFYNGNMITDYNLEDPYELYTSGKWTMERMYNMMLTVSGDVDGDGKITVANDRLGFVGRDFEYLPSLYSSGVMLAEVVGSGEDTELVSNLLNEKLVSIGEMCNEVFLNKAVAVMARDDATRNMFKEGRALFFSRLLGDFRNLRDKEDDYGLISFPSYEENTENPRVYIQNAFAMIIPIDIQDEDMVGTILEGLAADCFDNVMDVYFEKAVIAKGTRDANSELMLRDMRTRRAFDVSYTFGLSNLLSAYTAAVGNGNFASVAEKYAKSVNSAMEKAMTAFFEAVDNS